MMLKGQSRISLTTLIIIFPLMTLMLYGGLSHLFFFYIQSKNSETYWMQTESIFIKSEKNNLKEKIENLTTIIRYYEGLSRDKLKQDIQDTVSVSSQIINNIYRANKDMMAEDQLKVLIINALNEISLSTASDYLFLLDLSGNVLVHENTHLIGTNVIDIQDINGKYFIQEFIRKIQSKGQGFINYYWDISKEEKNLYKISYVKKLEAYDWFIGTGKYLKHVNQLTKDETLDYIRSNATFTDGYFFLSNSLNKIVFHPNQSEMLDKDSILDKFRMEGFYSDYTYMAYTSYVAQYDWYITAVKELKKVKQSIQVKKESQALIKASELKKNLYLIAFTWLVSLLLSLYLSTIINRMLKSYDKKIKEGNEKLIFQSRRLWWVSYFL